MDHEHDNDTREMPTFSFNRSTAVVEIQPNDDHWHWTWIPNDPPETVRVPTNYMELTDDGPQPVFEDKRWEPVVQHVDTRTMLNYMTPDEVQLFMGWCSHVHEQVGAHLVELAEAVKLAVDEKRWDGVAKIAADLHDSCAVRANVAEAGKIAFDLT